MPNWYQKSVSPNDLVDRVWKRVKELIPDQHGRFGEMLTYTIEYVLRDEMQVPENEIPGLTNLMRSKTVEDSYLIGPHDEIYPYPWTREQQQQAMASRYQDWHSTRYSSRCLLPAKRPFSPP
jgi:hypothetical protein